MSQAKTAETAAGVEAAGVEIATEPGAGWLDVGVTAAIVVAAAYYLYRKLWRNQGRCPDCGTKGEGACPAGPGAGPAKRRVEIPVDSIGGRKA